MSTFCKNYLVLVEISQMLKACANFAESKCDFLSNHYLISRIKSDVSTGDTTIGFMVGGYAWKMNGNE